MRNLMGQLPKTYREDEHYYAVIYLPSGHSYYSRPFLSRSSARRYALREQARHDWAARNGMIYNVRI